MFIMQKKIEGTKDFKFRILITGTADQKLRFWDLRDLQSQKYILGSMKVNHAEGDALTQIAVDSECSRLLTADTAGRIKLWDITKVDWMKDGLNGGNMGR